MKEKILSLLSDIENLKNKNIEEVKIHEGTFYLNDTDILCTEREFGDTRYPYEMDGLNLWVHAGGHINADESDLVIFRKAFQIQQESSLDFWGGIKKGKEWIPVSITGVTKQLSEPIKISRYTVYSKRCAYFIADTKNVCFALRANVTIDKKICFTASAINKTGKKQEVYICSYIDPHLRFSTTDTDWCPLGRQGLITENGSFKITRFSDPGDGELTNICVINKTVVSENAYSYENTISKAGFMGGMGRCMANAKSLLRGSFSNNLSATNSVDIAICADLTKLCLNKKEEALVCFTLDITHDEENADTLLDKEISISAIEENIKIQEEREKERLTDFDISFGEFKNRELNNVLLNRFLKNIQKQIDLCALGKNYAGYMLGVRDVFQQLTAASIWNKEDVRRKIVLCLNYIMSNGRAPRQFTVPAKEGVIPKFDIRQFIDQGLWIIETLHKYISKTGDYSILDEKCSYYEIIDEKNALYQKSDITDTVLDHLLKITAYLTSNIDERTNCLKILYGDWNDAVCGLGKTEDETKEFGTGVSVMATLQLYKLLKEMCQILSAVGGFEDKCTEYEEIRNKISEGLKIHSIQKDGDRRHILHGWGDKGSYNVGSLEDTDGVTRYSINPYSFWCICEMINDDETFKEDILKAYDVLDSKYGLKTFDKFFPKDMKGVGRIVDLTPGTAENACTYVHATTFAIMALFIIGEPERAWEQILKILPLTHKKLSKTPFVMPNSYCYNEEFCMDGESMGDWYTGSGAVLMRSIFEYALGIQVVPDGVKIETPYYIPCDNVSVKVKLKNKDVKFIYKNKNLGERKYFIDGAEQKAEYNELSKTKVLFIANEDIKENTLIEVVD